MKFIKNPYFLISLFFVIFFASYAFLFNYSSNAIEDKQEQVMLLERENVQNQITHSFHDIEVIIEGIDSYLATNPTDAELLEYFIAIDQENDHMASLYYGRPDKTMVNSTGFVPGPSFDLTTRIWYQMAIASNEIIYTPAFLNATQDRIIVTMAYAVKDGDTVIGVIASDIDIRTIINFVSERAIGETGYAFLMDTNKNLLAYPEIDVNHIDLIPVSEFSSEFGNLTGSGFNSSFLIEEEHGALAYTTVANGYYLLGIFLPEAEFTANMLLLANVFLLITILIATLAGTLVFLYYKHINRPVVRLHEDIKKINLVENEEYRLDENRGVGYLDIRQALNLMLETSDFYFKQKKLSQHKLMLENQRVKLLMESAADIIFEVDLDKRFVSVFGKGLQTIGMNPEHFIGKTVIEVFGEAGKDRDLAYSRALEGMNQLYDWQYEKNASIIYFESSVSPIRDENNQVIGAVGITRDITEPMLKQKEIEYLNIHDFLTGLYNRRFFVEEFAQLDHAGHYPLGIMMIDLNGLKILNDAYGHDIGDIALQKVANALIEVVTKHEIVSRIGGDEFTILFENTTPDAMQAIKEAINLKLTEIIVENIPISVAIGYEIKYDESTNVEETIKAAENFMYRNKVTEGKSIRNNAIKAILKTLTDKYSEEKIHSKRVSIICKHIGERMHIKSDDLKELEMAGLYHDIGKISIPDVILYKPGKLTPDEYDIIKSHTENGYNILRAADEYSNLAEYALSHHERWDGLGYPRGLKGTDIPLFSRIIGVADSYEAMTSDRVYRKRLSKEEAVQEIIRCAGTQFDPEIAAIFLELLQEDQI